MVLLKNGVLCRQKIYDSATGSSKEGTHLARRLIDGVFTQDHLLRCTYSGQPPHAQGKERMQQEVLTLNNTGKKAIIGNY